MDVVCRSAQAHAQHCWQEMPNVFHSLPYTFPLHGLRSARFSSGLAASSAGTSALAACLPQLPLGLYFQ